MPSYACPACGGEVRLNGQKRVRCIDCNKTCSCSVARQAARAALPISVTTTEQRVTHAPELSITEHGDPTTMDNGHFANGSSIVEPLNQPASNPTPAAIDPYSVPRSSFGHVAYGPSDSDDTNEHSVTESFPQLPRLIYSLEEFPKCSLVPTLSFVCLPSDTEPCFSVPFLPTFLKKLSTVAGLVLPNDQGSERFESTNEFSSADIGLRYELESSEDSDQSSEASSTDQDVTVATRSENVAHVTYTSRETMQRAVASNATHYAFHLPDDAPEGSTFQATADIDGYRLFVNNFARFDFAFHFRLSCQSLDRPNTKWSFRYPKGENGVRYTSDLCLLYSLGKLESVPCNVTLVLAFRYDASVDKTEFAKTIHVIAIDILQELDPFFPSTDVITAQCSISDGMETGVPKKLCGAFFNRLINEASEALSVERRPVKCFIRFERYGQKAVSVLDELCPDYRLIRSLAYCRSVGTVDIGLLISAWSGENALSIFAHRDLVKQCIAGDAAISQSCDV